MRRTHHAAVRNLALERIVDRAVKVAEMRRVKPTTMKKGRGR